MTRSRLHSCLAPRRTSTQDPTLRPKRKKRKRTAAARWKRAPKAPTTAAYTCQKRPHRSGLCTKSCSSRVPKQVDPSARYRHFELPTRWTRPPCRRAAAHNASGQYEGDNRIEHSYTFIDDIASSHSTPSAPHSPRPDSLRHDTPLSSQVSTPTASPCSHGGSLGPHFRPCWYLRPQSAPRGSLLGSHSPRTARGGDSKGILTSGVQKGKLVARPLLGQPGPGVDRLIRLTDSIRGEPSILDTTDDRHEGSDARSRQSRSCR